MGCLINVCGTSFSGSTMLDLMLGNSPQAFSCGEIYSRFRPTRENHWQPRCRCGAEPCPVWEKLEGVPEHRLHAEIIRRQGVDFVIDSSKDLCWILDSQRWARKNGLRIVNLVIWKDPLWLGYSHWRRGKPIADAQQAMIKYHSRLLGMKFPVAAVSYQRLTEDPAGQLREICRTAGMPYFPGKERFWEKQHHHQNGSRGIPEQLRSEEGKIRTPALPADYLKAYGEGKAGLEMADVLTRLEKLDVGRRGPEIFQDDRPRFRIWPYWYLRDHLRRLYLQYRPRPARRGVARSSVATLGRG